MASRDRKIFSTPYVSIIIQFLYSRFQRKIIYGKLPLYCMHLLAVATMVILNDNAREAIRLHKVEMFEAQAAGLPFEKPQPVDSSAIAF